MVGSRGRHTRETLAFFQSGEPQMVYAYDVELDRIVHLAEVTAADEREALRQQTRAAYRCVVDACRAPLTVRFCSEKRDHFAHLPRHGSPHSPESLWHQMGKAAIVQWVESLGWSGMTVAAEVGLRTSDFARRPDVTIAGSTGHRVFVEIQYAALSPDEWLRRHRDLTSGGDTAVWLLGHKGDHAQLTRRGALKLSPLARAMVQEGLAPLWINPIAGTIATPWGPRDDVGPCDLRGRTVSVDFLPAQSLETCQLSRDGIVTRRIEALRAASKQREQAALAAAASERQRREKRQRAIEKSRQHRSQLREAWLASSDHSWFTSSWRDQVPPFVDLGDVSQEFGDVLGLDVSHWQIIVHRYLAESCEPDEWVSFNALLTQVASPRARGCMVRSDYGEFRRLLVALEAAGVVDVLRNPLGHRIEAVRPRQPEPPGGASGPEPHIASGGTEVTPLSLAAPPTTSGLGVQSHGPPEPAPPSDAGRAPERSSWHRRLRGWFRLARD